MPHNTPDRRLLDRARGEYVEMPGLRLTFDQARRLWALDPATCLHLLSTLVSSGFLVRRADGSYVRRGTGEVARFAPEQNWNGEITYAAGHPR